MSEIQSPCSRGVVRDHVLVVTVLLEQIRDPQVSYALRDEILLLMDGDDIRHVVIDLEHVTFLGSIGLLAFLAVRRKLGGGLVVLCNVSEGIRSMLEVCLLVSKEPDKTASFEVADSLEAALAKVGG